MRGPEHHNTKENEHHVATSSAASCLDNILGSKLPRAEEEHVSKRVGEKESKRVVAYENETV